MRATQILLGFLQLNCFHVFAVRAHANSNEVTTTGLPNLATTTIENISADDVNKTADDSTLNGKQNATVVDRGRTDPNLINKEWSKPSKKPKPDLIVIKKKKLAKRPVSNSFSHDAINFPYLNIGTHNDESKETKNFVPSPELSEDSSHASVTHDTYSDSAFGPDILANFVPSTNPSIIPESYQPPVVGVHQKYHSHVGKLPIWPYPYENIDSKFKWKIISSGPNHQGDGKLLFPTEETTVSDNPTIYTKISSPALNIYRQPIVYEVSKPEIPYSPTPFSYPNVATSDIQTDIEGTPDQRLPPWMEMLHVKYDEHGTVKAPIEYYAKAIENQPKQPLINPRPQYGLTYIDNNILLHSVLKFLATAVPIGLAISALSPNVVTLNADSPPRLNGTFSRMNNTTRYPNPMTGALISTQINDDC